jgi:hypothetical protein
MQQLLQNNGKVSFFFACLFFVFAFLLFVVWACEMCVEKWMNEFVCFAS